MKRLPQHTARRGYAWAEAADRLILTAVLAGIALFLICLKYGDQWEQALFERFKK